METTRGGASYGDQQINLLQLLEVWAINLNFRGKQIVLDDFDVNMMAYCICEANLEYEDRKKNQDIKKPDKFSHIKWLVWEDMVYNYFTAMKNSLGLPLTYLIRKNSYPSNIIIDKEH